jgi:Tfp pilus assembly protein PilV
VVVSPATSPSPSPTDRGPAGRPPDRRRLGGFTIVEVAIGAVIMAIAATAMIQALASGAEMQATGQRQLLAAQILQQEMDNLRLQDWATINGLAAGPTTLTISTQFDTAITSAGLTKGTTITLSRSVSTVSSGLREVTLTVTWTMNPSGNAGTRTYTRVTSAYFTQFGLNLAAQRT